MKDQNQRDQLVNVVDGSEKSSGRIETMSPEEVIMKIDRRRELDCHVVSVNSYPPYVPEHENPNILVKGRWLERGGSAWWISTAGTGKSIASLQLAYCFGAGITFAGITPYRKMRTWIFQSEDSPSRITIDREDITAGLSESYPDVNWNDVGEKMVKFVNTTGKIGSDFIELLDGLIESAEDFDEKPDIIIINPFLAFIGGPVNDGAYVTPFLRGGEINGKKTCGLQSVLECHKVAVIIFHHTPKPPKDSEVSSWIKSPFPEYQGAGSSDITNWGRSFVTMMKVPDHPKKVCLIAGKNGSDIGWEEIDGSRRHYLAYSDEIGITGYGRHFWRELEEDELDDIIGKEKKEAKNNAEQAAEKIADEIKHNGKVRLSDFRSAFKHMLAIREIEDAKRIILKEPGRFGLSKKIVKEGKRTTVYIGTILQIDDDLRKGINNGNTNDSDDYEAPDLPF